jgi:hypothetical protein
MHWSRRTEGTKCSDCQLHVFRFWQGVNHSAGEKRLEVKSDALGLRLEILFLPSNKPTSARESAGHGRYRVVSSCSDPRLRALLLATEDRVTNHSTLHAQAKLPTLLSRAISDSYFSWLLITHTVCWRRHPTLVGIVSYFQVLSIAQTIAPIPRQCPTQPLWDTWSDQMYVLSGAMQQRSL